MKATEIPFQSLRPTTGAVSIKNMAGMGWSRHQQLPVTLRLWSTQVSHFQLSSWGGLRLWDEFLYKDEIIPASLIEAEAKPLIIPWGTLQRLSTCGTRVDMFVSNQRLVFDFETVSKLNTNEKYFYQVQIPLDERNIIEFHYYHCVSGYDTVVGIAGLDDFCDWPLKPVQNYSRKAIRFDVSKSSADAPDDKPPFACGPIDGGESPSVEPLVEEPIADENSLGKLLDKMALEGGCLVSSADCSSEEITASRSYGLFYVDDGGLGFVLRPARRLQ